MAVRHGVLSDVTRLQLLNLVATNPDGEVRAGQLVERVGKSAPTVSHHLALLLDAGLVRRRRRGRLQLYRITTAGRNALGLTSDE